MGMFRSSLKAEREISKSVFRGAMWTGKTAIRAPLGAASALSRHPALFAGGILAGVGTVGLAKATADANGPNLYKKYGTTHPFDFPSWPDPYTPVNAGAVDPDMGQFWQNNPDVLGPGFYPRGPVPVQGAIDASGSWAPIPRAMTEGDYLSMAQMPRISESLDLPASSANQGVASHRRSLRPSFRPTGNIVFGMYNKRFG